MNIFKWITSRAGMATSTVLKAVGMTTVVGVAGVAALQFLDSPADNTSFNPAGEYDPGEVVYVAGGSAGSYGSGGFSTDGYGSGEASSSMRISSAQINRLDRLTQTAPEGEVAEDIVAPSDPRAYQMGASEGLGMNANAGNEAELQNNPMGMMGDMMSNISNITQGVQGAAAGATPAQQGAPAGAPALAAAQKNWSKGAATGGNGGGNSFNSSFVVQDSGKSGSDRASNVTPGQAADVMKQFQGQMASIHDGMRMRSQSNFGNTEGFSGSWNASVANARTSKEANELKFIRKRSADAAANKHRSANEGSRAFLASTKISGGMRIAGENVTTGQGQGSADFNNENDVNLRALKAWADARDAYEEKRQQKLNELKGWFWGAVAIAIAAMIAIPYLTRAGGWWGWLAAAIIAAAALAVIVVGFVKCMKFFKEFDDYGFKGWPAAITILLPILAAGVGISFIGKVADWIIKQMDKILGLGEKTDLILAGKATGATAEAAAAGAAAAKSAALAGTAAGAGAGAVVGGVGGAID